MNNMNIILFSDYDFIIYQKPFYMNIQYSSNYLIKKRRANILRKVFDSEK